MSEIELEIGSMLLIGRSIVTIVDIDDDEVFFKIDEADSHDKLISHEDDFEPAQAEFIASR